MSTTAHPDVQLRDLRADECEAVAAILRNYAQEKVLLWRTTDDIRAHRPFFRVALLDEQVVGCLALHPYGQGLTELRSLAVTRHCQRRGIGRLLVADALLVAAARGRRRVFTLTRQVDFFRHFGFVVTDRHAFPEKVWADCDTCSRRNDCVETAMVCDIDSAPALDARSPAPTRRIK